MYSVLLFLAAATAVGAHAARRGTPPSRAVLIALSIVVGVSMASLRVV